MTLERISLLRNIGQFESVSAGAQLPLTKLSLIYAENGRGKTTIASILRSLMTGDPTLIEERQRLGTPLTPHVVLNFSGSSIVFQNGAWSCSQLSSIAVFDDAFVAANVCSGISVETAHRQNLHELILGAQGVTLNAMLQSHVSRIEEHNRNLRTKGDAIPVTARGTVDIDSFCGLPVDPDLDVKIQDAERSLSAARSADAIRQRALFKPLTLPRFDISAISSLLARNLTSLESEAVTRVTAHIQSLGQGGESWVGDGMHRIIDDANLNTHVACPFCAQDLGGSDLIRPYQAYFSESYGALKAAIEEGVREVVTAHGSEVPAAFERAVRVVVETREFWRVFTDLPDFDVDTASISRTWSAARDAVLRTLRSKAAAPLENIALTPDDIAAIEAHQGNSVSIADLSAAVQNRNTALAIVKEQAASASVSALVADLNKLLAIKARHEIETAVLCKDYLDEKAAKTATEASREQARAALDQYRRDIFPAYEQAVNEYLRRFNAGFRLGSVVSVNNRGGSAVNYSVLINNVAVGLTADGGPSFKNTLSAGDRNTLALAFFFASLDQDPQLGQKVVVIDDPITSLDEHRSLMTVQEMQRLSGRVNQMIVLSHSKAFLCAIWEGGDRLIRSAMRIVRQGVGSTLARWDVRQDSITEHDRRHEQVRDYIMAGNPSSERAVAAALRPILEVFMRVAYPADFLPGALLGSFVGICQQRCGTPNQILSARDSNELRALLDYANRFHHDTNAVWETAAINDLELMEFAKRTLRFSQR